LLSDGLEVSDDCGNIILKSDSYGIGLTPVGGDGPDGAEITEGTFSFSTYEGMTAELPLGEANYDYDIYGGAGAAAASTFAGRVGDGEGISTWVQVGNYAEVEIGRDANNLEDFCP
jgi:hypothetical protein